MTDDVVKVEIWDIVDKGKVKKRDGLKMDTEEADVVNFSLSLFLQYNIMPNNIEQPHLVCAR